MAPLVGDHTKPGGTWKGEEWEGDMQGGGLLHQWLLGGWGVMIGEVRISRFNPIFHANSTSNL